MFRRRTANGANLVSFLVGASHAPMFYFLSLYLQQVLGFAALATGLAILPVALINMAVSGTVLSKALHRLGFKGTLIAGLLLLAFGLALFARAPVPGSYLFDVLPACFLVAVGLPAAFVGTNIAAVWAVKPEETGLASGLVNTMQRLGSGIGIALLTALAVGRTNTVTTHTSQQALALGFQAAFLGAAFLALLGAFVALTLIQRSQGNLSTSGNEPEASPQQAELS
jgi:fucose permease